MNLIPSTSNVHPAPATSTPFAGPRTYKVAVALGMSRLDRDAAVAWYVARGGTTRGCPALLDQGHVSVLDIAIRADMAAARAVDRSLGLTVEPTDEPDDDGQYESAADWPAWTDAARWEPTGHTPEDESWWSAESPTNRDGYVVIGRRPAPAPIRRPVNPWTDADQLAHHGCV